MDKEEESIDGTEAKADAEEKIYIGMYRMCS